MSDDKDNGKTDETFQYLIGEINYESIKDIVRKLMSYDLDTPVALRPTKPVLIGITSHGGNATTAFALIDAMLAAPVKVNTLGLGVITSAALFVFLAGNERIITSQTMIQCHQFTWGMRDKYHELKAGRKVEDWEHNMIATYISKRTGKSKTFVEKELLGPSDRWITPEEALELGIATKLVKTL